MRNFLQRLAYKFSTWMYGRYGTDELNIVLIIASFAVAVLAIFPFLRIISPLSTLFIILVCVRMFSKNIDRRREELDKYYRVKNKIVPRISLYKKMWDERKTHRYFKCKICKTVLRVPKRNNKIEVTCPNCRNKTIK